MRSRLQRRPTEIWHDQRRMARKRDHSSFVAPTQFPDDPEDEVSRRVA
jgi:hypothetical protein